jgi:outer membrane protein assembly factor BamB
MRKKLLILFILSFMIIFSSCVQRGNKQPDYVIRMTPAQIREGAFTGGRLIYSRDESVNMLRPGYFIPVIEMTKTWVKGESSEEYTFETTAVTYAYYYIVAIDDTKITMDYLSYNEEGTVLYHEENIEITQDYVVSSIRNKSSSESSEGHPYAVRFLSVDPREDGASQALTGACLLSFPNEIPDETLQMNPREDTQSYLTVLFRLQPNATTQYSYSNGLICAHHSEPRLVVNVAFFAEESVQVLADGVVFLNYPSLEMPAIGPGDYLLLTPESSEDIAGTRRITEGTTQGDNFLLTTESADFIEVTGGVELSISGDIEDLATRYGYRGTIKLIDLNEIITLWHKQGLELDLDLKFLLELDIGMDITACWNELSMKGHFYMLSTDHLYLILKVLTDNKDPENNLRVTLKEWKTRMQIGPVVIYADYLINAVASWDIPELDKLQLGGGPWLDGKLGFDYDIGVKLKFAWGIFPYPSFWADFGSDSFLDMGFKLITPELPNEISREMQLNLGIEFQPKFRFGDAIGPSFTLPFMFENNLKKVNGKWSYSLDLHPSIDFWINLKFLDYRKEWYIGRIWEHTWNLYKNNPQYLDERDKGHYSFSGFINTAPAIGEDGYVYFTTENGYLYALTHDPELGKFTCKWVFRYPNNGYPQFSSVGSPIVDKSGVIYYTQYYQNVGSGYFSGIIAVSNNQMLWSKNFAFPQTVNALAMGADANDNTLLFAGDNNGTLFELDNSGKVLWQKHLGAGLSISAISVTQNGTLAVIANRSDNQSQLFLLDFNGNVLQSRDTSLILSGKSDTYAGKIAINRDGSFFLSTDNRLWAIASGCDRTLWEYTAGEKISSNAVIAKDGKIYFGCKDNNLYCLNHDGSLSWKYDAGSEIIASPLIGTDGHIYIATSKGVVFALASRDILDKDGTKIYEMGKSMWRSPKNPDSNLGQISGSPAISAEGVLYVPSQYNFYAVKTDTRGLSDAPWPRNGYNNQNTSGISYIPSSLRVIEKNDLKLKKMEGESLLLQIEALGGFSPYSYQWYKGNAPITGANQNTYRIENLAIEDEGDYYVLVKDSFTPHYKSVKSHISHLAVYSTQVGKKRWEYKDSFIQSPLIDNKGGLIALSKEGMIYRFDSSNGNVSFSRNENSPQSAPVIKIYDNGGDPVIMMINSATNKVHALKIKEDYFQSLWEEIGTIPSGFRNLSLFYDGVVASRFDGTITSFFIDSGHFIYDSIYIGCSMPTDISIMKDSSHVYIMYFGTDSNELAAVSFEPLGRIQWKYKTKGKVVSPIAIDTDGTLYFADNTSTFYALTANGTKRWSYDLTEGKNEEFKGVTASPIISSAGLIYIAKNNGKVYAFDRSGKKKWTFQSEGGVYATPILGNDNTLYICTTTGVLHALNATTGQPTGWQRYNAENCRIIGSPLIIDGKLIVAADSLIEGGSGRIFALNITSTGLDFGPWPKYRRDNQNTASVQ